MSFLTGGISVERSQDWLDQAKKDIEHARFDMENGFYDWSCFSSQQGAEKAVKAVFQKIGAEAWGHVVADLLEALDQHFNVPKNLIEKALELDKSYIPTRYPDAHPSGAPWKKYTKKEARRLLGYADEIVKFCSNILSKIQQERDNK
jgi:HEPN domain-containing protein